MNRIAIFAHYDRDGIIDDYVIYYLRGLLRVAHRILFISDCELGAGEAVKLQGLAELVFAGRHREYDFGSWKRGFAHLNYDLSEWDEVIVANDSCYAPIFPFEDAFARMDKADCDFWGPTAAKYKEQGDYLCSYFLVFRHSILSDEAFIRFWKGVAPQPNITKVLERYEVGLSQLLSRRGYRWSSSLPPVQGGHSILTTDFLRDTLPNGRSSWLKVRLLRENPMCAAYIGKYLALIDPHYPRRLIDNYLIRLIGSATPPHHNYPEYHLKIGFLTINSKIKRRIRNEEVHDHLKIYTSVFGLRPLKVYSRMLG